MWALAKLRWQPEDSLLSAFQSNMRTVGEWAKPQEISMILWASATLSHPLPQPLLLSLYGWVEASAAGFNAQGVSNTLWALAKITSDKAGGWVATSDEAPPPPQVYL